MSGGGHNAETYVEAGAQALTVPQDLEEELFVDDKLPKNGRQKPSPKNGSNGKNGHHAAPAPHARTAPPAARASAKPAAKAPPPAGAAAKKKGHRASERRRERGEVPLGPEVGTSTSLNQKREAAGGESGQLRYATGVLTCVKGPEEGLALNLLEGSYSVGRGRENSFVLKDIAASRHHLRIDVEGGRVTVTDAGSGNGTRVNGKVMQMFVLEEGDKVELGNSVLVFSRGTKRAKDSSSALSPDPVTDDAQQRIERAAEKLAAELGDRFRDDDSDAPLVDPEAAPTATARPRSRGHKDEESSRKKPRPPMPDELWNDALTRVPLSEVVPADSPLGPKESSGRPPARAARPPSSPPPPSARPPAARPPPPPPSLDLLDEDLPPPPPARSPALTSPPVQLPPKLPAATIPPGPAVAHGVVAEQKAAPAWTYVVLPAIIVVLVLGTALGGWALFRYVNGSPDVAAPTDPLSGSVTLALEALAQDDVDAALTHAQRAYELQPGDKTVLALLKTIQDRRTALGKDVGSPSSDEADGKAAGAKLAKDDDAKGKADEAAAAEAAAAKAAEAEAARAEAEQARAAEAREARAAEARAAEAKAAKPAPFVEKKRAPAVVKKKAKPKPRPKPRSRSQQRRGMSDDQAGALYRKAVLLVRDDEEAKGCGLMRKIANEAPQGSNWKVKAAAAVSRYGCD